MMLKKIFFPVAVLALFSMSSAYSQIVVPPQFQNQSGTFAESIFGCTLFINGTRAQAIFPSEDLIAGTIGGYSMRLPPGFMGFGPSVIPDVTIIMSTTNVEPQNLSTTFDDNTGPDAMTVFAGDLIIGTVPDCNTDPCPFSLSVLFQTPFEYNPDEGNLLLDIIVPPCMFSNFPPLALFDSTFELNAVVALDANAPEGGQAIWKITRFQYLQVFSAVPAFSEWGVIAMAMGLGLIGFFVARRRKITA